MQKKVAFTVKLFLFVFCAAGVYLLASNFMLKESLKNIGRAGATSKEKDLVERHKKLQDAQTRDLEEKYQADMVSYQAMVKRLEQEKNKQKELKGEIKQLGNKVK